MPRRDGTGPNGFGAQTGRRQGPCANGEFRGNFGFGFRKLFGRMGNRRGLGMQNRSGLYTESEEQAIKNELEYLEQEIKLRKQILSEIDDRG